MSPGLVVDPGPAADHVVGVEAEDGPDQGGRDRRVADPHVARDQQVGAGVDLLVGHRPAGGEAGLDLVGRERVLAVDRPGAAPYLVAAHLGRGVGEVVVDPHVDDPDPGVVRPAPAR